MKEKSPFLLLIMKYGLTKSDLGRLTKESRQNVHNWCKPLSEPKHYKPLAIKDKKIIKAIGCVPEEYYNCFKK